MRQLFQYQTDINALVIANLQNYNSLFFFKTLTLFFFFFSWWPNRRVKKGRKAARKELKPRQSSSTTRTVLQDSVTGKQIHLAPSLKSKIILKFSEHIHVKQWRCQRSKVATSFRGQNIVEPGQLDAHIHFFSCRPQNTKAANETEIVSQSK